MAKIYIYHYTIFGQVNDSNAYGGGTYQSAEYGDTTLTQASKETSENTTGSLANSGVDVVMPLTLGIAMVVGSVIALAKMRKSKKTQ